MASRKFEPLRDLNDLGKRNPGLHKRWVYKNKQSFEIGMDFLQKISFSIQDINTELENVTFDNKTISFVIVCIDWIKSGYSRLLDDIKNEKNEVEFPSAIDDAVKKDFSFSKCNELKRAYRYFTAIRSFIVAHPLSTNRHKRFSLDGRFICEDVRKNDDCVIRLLGNHPEHFYFIDYDGLRQSQEKADFYLMIYDAEYHKNKLSKYVGCNFEDILTVGRLTIEALYELDEFLSNKKMKDFK